MWVLVVISFSASAQCDSVRLAHDSLQWVVAGNLSHVYAMERYNDTLYFGGGFNYVGKYTGSCVGIDRTSGNIVAQNSWPKSNGRVNSIIPDGAGGIIIAGDFTRVGDSLRNNLAHINSLGQVSSFKANADAEVKSVVLQNGTVYIGGRFTLVNGTARSLLAGIDFTTSAVTTWNPGCVGYSINALATDGTNLYVGGEFIRFNAVTRPDLAAFDLATGNLTAMNIGVSGPFSAYPNTLLVHNNRLYIGGEFSTIGGITRNNAAAIDLATGTVTGWNPNANGYVSALAARNDTVYLGGVFFEMGNTARRHLASVNANSGSLHSWNPQVSYPSYVLSIAVSGSTVYAGGYFEVVGGQYRNNFVALDVSTALVTSLNVRTYHYYADVSALYINGNTIYLGGKFASFGGEERQSFAALDIKNNKLLPLNLYFDQSAQIKDIKIENGILYLGGHFGSFRYGGGMATYRTLLASFDINNQYAPTTWNPLSGIILSSQYDEIKTIEITPSYFYLGGEFSFTSGGTTYNAAIRVNRVTGAIDPWKPSFIYHAGLSDFAVNSISTLGSRVYMGGAFARPTNQYIGNFMYSNVAGNTNVYFLYDGAVNDMKRIGNRLFVGGNFTTIGSVARNGIAALDTSATAGVYRWNPNVMGNVNSIAYNKDRIYVGGHFFTAGGKVRNSFAVVDTVRGGLWPWNPSFDLMKVMSYTNSFSSGTPVRKILASSDTVFVAGDFEDVVGKNVTGLARFHFDNYELPNVKIQASVNPVCARDVLAVTANSNISAVNYEWKVNGAVVGTGNVYNYVPSSGDKVSVRTTVAGAGCFVRDTAVDTIIIQVQPRQVPGISITGPAKQVNSWNVTINATVSNVTGSYTIDWKNNGVIFSSTLVPTVTYAKGSGTDNITATIRPVDCYDTAVSNALVIQENVGVDDISSSKGIVVYPNPVKDMLSIKGLSTGDQVEVIDITGRTLMNFRPTTKAEQQYSVKELQPGRYILKVSDADGNIKISKPILK